MYGPHSPRHLFKYTVWEWPFFHRPSFSNMTSNVRISSSSFKARLFFVTRLSVYAKLGTLPYLSLLPPPPLSFMKDGSALAVTAIPLVRVTLLNLYSLPFLFHRSLLAFHPQCEGDCE